VSWTVKRILVVEDDRDIADLVSRYLTRAGFSVEITDSGADALSALGGAPPDLMILDLMLPHVNGLEVCRLVRANPRTSSIPIIMLTARAEPSERITGLDIGADDYIGKPFSPGEVVARVRALLRRTARESAGSSSAVPSRATSTETGPVAYGRLVVDAGRHVVTVDGAPVTLTAKEFLLLRYLLAHRGRVLSRDRLLTDVWGYTYTGGTRTVDVHVRRLREKLPPLATALVTVKQFGYKLVEEPPSASPGDPAVAPSEAASESDAPPK
jgi:two-component system, OmpR family, alkaline phosphatase synthesis response regulator PhoP